MLELCLMASHGYPPGLVLGRDQSMSMVIKDCQPFFTSSGTRQEVSRSGSLNLRPYQNEEPWNLIEPSQFVKFDSAIRSPVPVDAQDDHPGSLIFSFGIAEQYTRHEKILQFLMNGLSEEKMGELDLSFLPNLTGLQNLTNDVCQEPFASSLVYPSSEFYAQKPLLDFVGDLAHSSKITVKPDGQVLFTGTGTEMKDLLSVVAEFYLSKNSVRWRTQSTLIPYYTRLDTIEVGGAVNGASVKLHSTTVAPLKSPEKVKVKPSTRKRNGKKVFRERDLYKKNYFHACESLLSLMLNKRRHGKTTILSLKKSGPELPELLTQFSAGIAGTGLAVLFSVVCKVAYGRVPLCASKLVNTGLGFGLVWLSWAVNKLRDNVIYVSRNTGNLSLKEDEMIRRVDKSVTEIYFRAAAVMAVAVLRIV